MSEFNLYQDTEQFFNELKQGIEGVPYWCFPQAFRGARRIWRYHRGAYMLKRGKVIMLSCSGGVMAYYDKQEDESEGLFSAGDIVRYGKVANDVSLLELVYTGNVGAEAFNPKLPALNKDNWWRYVIVGDYLVFERDGKDRILGANAYLYKFAYKAGAQDWARYGSSVLLGGERALAVLFKR